MSGARREPSRAEYQAQRRRLLVSVYFSSVEEKNKFQVLAKASGYSNFSPWIVQMLHNATSGHLYDSGHVDGLEKELERIHRWLQSAREEALHARAEVDLLRQQREALLLLLRELPTLPQIESRLRSTSVSPEVPWGASDKS